MNIEKIILDTVNNLGGCKESQLIPAVAEAVFADDPDKEQASLAFQRVPDIIEEMVERGELMEIEYCLPGSDRLKSFLVPANTSVRIRP